MSSMSEGKELCANAAKLREQWQEEDNLSKAERLFRSAVEKFPDLWMAHFGLGELLILNAARSRVKSGEPFDEGVSEVKRAAALHPTQPEPLLKLAATLATTDIDTAERYYRQAQETRGSQTQSMYPVAWQAIDHFDFAIEAAEKDRHGIAVDAFCSAINMDEEYAGRLMPSPAKANADWQSALRRLGKTRWFEQRREHETMMQRILAGKPLDAEPEANKPKGTTGCLGIVLVVVCAGVIAWLLPR